MIDKFHQLVAHILDGRIDLCRDTIQQDDLFEVLRSYPGNVDNLIMEKLVNRTPTYELRASRAIILLKLFEARRAEELIQEQQRVFCGALLNLEWS